jgi:hypothetical protein
LEQVDEQTGTRHVRIRGQMDLARVSWIVTVLIALLTAVLPLLSDYTGYAALSVAVAASASINLL